MTPKRKWAYGGLATAIVALVVVASLLWTGNLDGFASLFRPHNGPENTEEISDGDFHVYVPEAALPADLSARVADIPALPSVAEGMLWMEHVLPPIDLAPHGPLPAPVPFTFDLGGPLPADEILFVRANHSDPYDLMAWEDVEPIGYALSADRRFVTVTLDHLSAIDISKAKPSAVKQFIESFLEEAFSGAFSTKSKDISCAGQAEAESKGYSFTSDPKPDQDGPLKWCHGYENGDRVIKVSNLRRYPVEFTQAAGFPQIDEGDIPFSMVQARRLNHTIVMPRETMTFHVNPIDPGKSATLIGEASNWGTALAAVDVVAKVVLILFAGLTGKATESAISAIKAGRMTNLDDIGLKGVTMAEYLQTIMGAGECAQALGSGDDYAKILKACFTKEVLLNALKLGAAVLIFAPIVVTIGLAIAGFMAISSAVFGLIDFPRVLANFIGDKRDGKRAKQSIAVARAKPKLTLDSYKGEWGRDGVGGSLQSYILSGDSSGVFQDFDLPGCPAEPYCTFLAQLDLELLDDGRVRGTVRSTSYFEGGQNVPLPPGFEQDALRPGDKMVFALDEQKRLIVTYEGRFSDAGRVNFCTGITDKAVWDSCGTRWQAGG